MHGVEKWHWRRRLVFIILISADAHHAFLDRCQHKQPLRHAPVKPVPTRTLPGSGNYDHDSVKLRQMGNDCLSNLSATDDDSNDEDTSALQLQTSSTNTTPLNDIENQTSKVQLQAFLVRWKKQQKALNL
mmetsp:Transcript_22289/g.31856  ORF Transcript_22289/g.31856 Transcript_22289/m.31856 type:complete len:130 (+) Transcript_22289:278-667(+)